MHAGQSETDRAYAEILVARGYLDRIQVEKAQARLVEARVQGTAGSLIELLLEEALLDPDVALAVRAEFDVQLQDSRDSKHATQHDTGEGARSTSAYTADEKVLPPQESTQRPAEGSADMTLTAVGDATHYPETQPVAGHSGALPSRAGEPGAPHHANNPDEAAAIARHAHTSNDTRKASSQHTSQGEATSTSTGTSGPSTRSDPLLGHVLGGCKLLEKIGEGGMGAVYRGQHLGLEKAVAVKVLPPATTKNRARVERFRREAKSAARIEHPNIVQILNVGEADGYHFIVMQYIDGEDLRHCLKRRGPLSPEELIEAARQVAEGLKYAHDAGIVHRDIKPDNIMFDQDARVKITDFGLAKALDDTDTTTTRPGRAVGTPYYMSPEQCAGKTVDERSDIYSLGATLYHVLTGQRPFKGETPVQTALMHLREPVKPPRSLRPDVPEVLDRFICKMLSKAPEKRQQNCHELLVEIDAMEKQMEAATRLREIRALQADGAGTAAAGTVPLREHSLEGHGTREAKAGSEITQAVEGVSASVSATTPDGANAAQGADGVGAGGVGGEGGARAAVNAARNAGVAMMSGPSARPFVLLVALLAGGLFAGILIGLLSANGSSNWTLGETNGPEESESGDEDESGDATGTENESGVQADEQAQRYERARAHWVGLELTLVDEIDEGNFVHALRRLDAFLADYGDTPAANNARALRMSVQQAAHDVYADYLERVMERVAPLRESHRFAEAMSVMRARDPTPELEALGLTELRDRYWSDYRDLEAEAERVVEAALREARALVAEDVPRYYDALERLDAESVVGLERLLTSLQEARAEIEAQLVEARDVRYAAVLDYLEAAAARASAFSQRVQEWEPRLDTLAGIRDVRTELREQWTSESHTDILAPTVRRLDDELAQLEALHGEIAERIDSRNRHEILLHGEDDLYEVRIGEVNKEQSRFVAEVQQPTREAGPERTFRFDELSRTTLGNWISRRFQRNHPFALALFSLTRGQEPEGTGLGARYGHGPLAPYKVHGRAWELLHETERLLIEKWRGRDVEEAAVALRELGYDEVSQLDPHSGPVKLARARLLALHFADVRLAQKQLEKILERYFDQPLFTLTRAELALMREPPQLDVAESASRRWITWMDDYAAEVPREQWSPATRYFQSRALLYHSQARALIGRLQGREPDTSVELNDARRLDPSARDIYDSLQALEGAER